MSSFATPLLPDGSRFCRTLSILIDCFRSDGIMIAYRIIGFVSIEPLCGAYQAPQRGLYFWLSLRFRDRSCEHHHVRHAFTMRQGINFTTAKVCGKGTYSS